MSLRKGGKAEKLKKRKDRENRRRHTTHIAVDIVMYSETYTSTDVYNMSPYVSPHEYLYVHIDLYMYTHVNVLIFFQHVYISVFVFLNIRISASLRAYICTCPTSFAASNEKQCLGVGHTLGGRDF